MDIDLLIVSATAARRTYYIIALQKLLGGHLGAAGADDIGDGALSILVSGRPLLILSQVFVQSTGIPSLLLTLVEDLR